MTFTTLELTEPYVPRAIRYHGLWSPGEWQIKRYSIHHRDRQPPDDNLFAAAQEYATPILRQAAALPDTYGVGFLIVHAGREGNFLLVDWWTGENMLQQTLAFAPADAPAAFAPAPPGLSFCVWELAVLGFERQAWIDTVLACPTGPDLHAYLSRQFEAQV